MQNDNYKLETDRQEDKNVAKNVKKDQNISKLIEMSSYDGDVEMNAEIAKKLSLKLEEYFGELEYVHIRSLQRGNGATQLVTTGIDLLVCKEHLHEDEDWVIPFNVLNDIVVSLFIHENLQDCPNLPNIVSISVKKHMTHIFTKFIPLRFDDVFERILPRSFLKKRMYELIFAMHVLHKNGFAHRDIKPENIRLKDDATLILIDYDTSCRRFDDVWKTKVCTVTTCPPELMCNNQKNYNGKAADIFSAGCTIVAMINDGKLPFGLGADRLSQIKMFTPSKRIVHRIGVEGAELITSMLFLNPESRPSSLELLKNDFFKSC